MSRNFPHLESDPKAEGRRRPMDEAPFVRESRMALRKLSGFSDLVRPRKELYRRLVVGSASDPLSERHGGGDLLPLELGTRIELLEQF